MSKSTNAPAQIHRPIECPRWPRWCAEHIVDEVDGTVLHMSASVGYDGLGWFSHQRRDGRRRTG
jgi:hypothetical protein